jgi:hypothetical protein
MKKKLELLLYNELNEIEATDFVLTFPHLKDKIAFIAHDLRNEYPHEAKQLLDIYENINDYLSRANAAEQQQKFIAFKNEVALVIKQLLDIED